MFKKYYFCVFILFLNSFCYVVAWHCRDSILKLPGICTLDGYCESAKELKFYYGIPSRQCYYGGICCVSAVSGNVNNNQHFLPRISATRCISNKMYEDKWDYRTTQSYLAQWKITNGLENIACAGAPITPFFILTSARCTVTDNMPYLKIYLPGTSFTEIAYAEQLITYPSFDKMTLRHDIGLIKLTSPISNSRYYYPCLWQTDAIYSKKLTIFDLESRTSDLYIPYQLKSYEYTQNPDSKNKLTLYKNEPCEEFIVKSRNGTKTPNKLHMNDYKICLANLEATKPGCTKIISGTPITTNIENTIYIVGVASERECKTGHLMRHSRVSSYLGWIEHIVWRNGYVSPGYQRR